MCVVKCAAGSEEFNDITIDVALEISEWIEHAEVG